MNEDRLPGIEFKIGRRTYRMSDSLLAVLLVGIAVAVLLQVVEMYVYFSPATIGAAKAAALLFGIWVGIKVDIYDDEDDDSDEVITTDGEVTP